jgi:hypothetical protein
MVAGAVQQSINPIIHPSAALRVIRVIRGPSHSALRTPLSAFCFFLKFADTFPPETSLYGWKPKPTIERKGKT